jgi:hypothetical protein
MMQAFVDDFYQLSACNDLMEIEAQEVALFIRGLRVAIQDKVSMHPIFTLTEAVRLATEQRNNWRHLEHQYSNPDIIIRLYLILDMGSKKEQHSARFQKLSA